MGKKKRTNIGEDIEFEKKTQIIYDLTLINNLSRYGVLI